LRAIVVANGELENPARLKARLAGWAEARVIAADGGLRNCRKLGLVPETIVGDFDSIDPAEIPQLQKAGVQLLRRPRQKDETDLELALFRAHELGIAQVVILGALGGRLDMSLANLLLLAHPRLAELEIRLWSSDQTAWLLRPPGDELAGQPGDLLSLIPLAGDASGVVTEGLEYPLRGETLHFGLPRGVSNVLSASSARVQVQTGLLFAVHSHPPPGQAERS
jgi:thiamine pyrophosphokinase